MGRQLALQPSTLKAAGIKAGFSPSTMEAPQRNGLSRDEVLGDFLATQREERLGDLRPLSVRTLREVMADTDVSPQTRATAAAVTLRLVSELPEEDQDETWTGQRAVDCAADYLRLEIAGAEAALRLGPERALEILRARLAELPVSHEAREMARRKGRQSTRAIVGGCLCPSPDFASSLLSPASRAYLDARAAGFPLPPEQPQFRYVPRDRGER